MSGPLTPYLLQAGGWISLENQAPVVLPPANQPPGAVDGLQATPSSTSVVLSWGAAVDPEGGAVRYQVMRDSTPLAVVTTRTYTASGLNPATTYSFSVRAIDDKDALGPSSAVTTTTLTPYIPGSKPQADTFGYKGSLTPWVESGTIYLNAGTYQNFRFPGPVVANAPGVTIKNSYAPSFVSYYGNFTLQDVECGYVGVDAYYRAISTVRMSGIKINGTDGDGLNLFSASGKVISDVVIDGLYAAGFDYTADPSAHGDGIQIRGVSGCLIRNATINMGPWQEFGGYKPKNAAIYIENVNSLTDISIEDVWLNGGGYTFYTAAGTSNCKATRMRVDGTDFGYAPINIVGGRPGGWVLTDCTGPTGAPL